MTPAEKQELQFRRSIKSAVESKDTKAELAARRALQQHIDPGGTYARQAGYGLEKSANVPIPLRADVLDNVQDSDITVDATGKRAAVVNGQTIPLQAGFDEATDAPQYIARTGEAKEPKPLTGKKLSREIVRGAQTHPTPQAHPTPDARENMLPVTDVLTAAGMAAETLPDQMRRIGTGAKQAAIEYLSGVVGDLADVSPARIEAAQERAAINARIQAGMPLTDPWSAADIASSVVSGIPATATSLGVGVLAGPAAGLAAAGSLAGADQFGESLAKGRTAGGATADALASGAFEIIGEVAPLGYFIKNIRGIGKVVDGNAIGRVIKGTALEGGGEAVTQGLQEAYNAGVLDEKTTLPDALERIGFAATVGAAMGGATQGAIETANVGAKGAAKGLDATARFWQKTGVNAKLGDLLSQATRDRAFTKSSEPNGTHALDAINDVPDAELQEASSRYKVLRTDGGLSEKQAKDIMREDIAKAVGVDVAKPAEAGKPIAAAAQSAAPTTDDVFASYDEPAQPERAPEPGDGLAGADAGAGASDLGLREPVAGARNAASIAGSERSDAAADSIPVGARDAALEATGKESLTAGDFVAFPKESGTLGIPRAEMPQVKAEHRGALTNFLNARGIAHDEETVDASTLKPTQAEYSPSKVQQAKDFKEGDRAVLVSADGHIVDGHHQAIAAMDKAEPIRIIRLDAPIKDLLPIVKQFPSAAKAVSAPKPPRAPVEAKSRQGTRSTKEISETLRGDADLTQRIEGLAAGAGWATMGGERIPNAADGETARHFGQDERVRNIDHMSWDGSQVPTTWEANPGHEWFRHHQNRLPNNADGSATKEAVRKAAAGELMKPAERRHVDELIRIAKGERTAEGDAFSDQMIEALTQHGGLNPDIEENHTDADVIAKAFSIVGEDEADAANSRYDSDVDLLEWAQGVVDGQQRTQDPAGADREGAEPQQGQEASREQGQREGDGRQVGRSLQGEVADEYAPAVEADRKGATPQSGNDLVLPDRKEPGSDTPAAQKAPAADAVPKSAKPEAKPAASEKPTPRLDTRPLREIKVKRLAVTPSGQQLETTQRADLAMKEIDGRIASVKALIRCLSA